MTTFLIAALAMVCVALGFLLVPLLRRPVKARRATKSAQEDLAAIYRDQMTELQDDLAGGTLSQNDRRESELELERRMLVDLSPSGTAKADKSWRKSLKTAFGVMALLPIAAGGLYWKLGSPDAFLTPAESVAAHAGAHATTLAGIAELVDALALKLERNPDDAEGWSMLARSLVFLQRDAQALAAFDKAIALAPADADLLADYADAAAVVQQGRLGGKPMQLVRRALKVDPGNPKALALAGTDAFDHRNYRTAAELWEAALAGSPQ